MQNKVEGFEANLHQVFLVSFFIMKVREFKAPQIIERGI